jgi:DNA (cytosine-5)-methyltransferase 1
MKLYEEIILLKTFYKGKYCVENVIPYYHPLIPAHKRGRHLYWTNFALPTVLSNRIPPKDLIKSGNIKIFSKYHEYDFYKYIGTQNLYKMARNLVDYEAGKTILESAIFSINQPKHIQQTLF